MPANAANFADAVIATAPSPATSGLSLTVATGYGARFSTASFNAAIGPGNVRPSLETHELVTVASVAGDVFTLSARGIEGTTPRAIVAGDVISQLPTAADWLALVASYDSPNWTGAHTWLRDLAVETSGQGIALKNANAAANGAQRRSPRFSLVGNGWKTSSGGSSIPVEVYFEVKPNQSNDLADSTIEMGFLRNGVSYNDPIVFGFGATTTFPGIVSAISFSGSWQGDFYTDNQVLVGPFGALKVFEQSSADKYIQLSALDSVGSTADRVLSFDLQDADRTLSLGADWKLGTYTASVPTATGKLTVTVNGQAYEIPARLV
jgi:hypothetical protein